MKPRTVLLATINYDHPQEGMARAFEYVFGHDQVDHFDYLQHQRNGDSIDQINEAFVRTVLDEKPTWIWLQVQETNVLSAASLIKIKQALPETIITHWTGDYRPTISAYLQEICQAADVTFISSRGQLDLFRQAGAREVRYLQVGVDWEEDVMGIPFWEPPFKTPEIVFVGNFYGDAFPTGSAQRLQIIRAFQDAKLDIGVVGNGWPSDINVVGTCHVKRQHHVYRKAKLALSINHINDVDCYYSDRQLIAMASGTPVLAWRVPGLQYEFNITGTTQSECETFTLPEEAIELAQRLLARPDWAKQLGAQGRKAVMERHDWRNRVLHAMEMLDALGLKVA